ncbi:hypothetical protein NEF87_004527 [Candidatus Lokiarchaeum ossiferum]|uniref:B box-type domain-containing protein n=1 Tax=Candidatus Lokiarchaeum ossiferum TaxID=2951803 RepID=A0ABY6HXJ1_9ARCH|nr:hypothetical protein NEF87_004527 [Candidatus Lokiarchaeum sp. B-35]
MPMYPHEVCPQCGENPNITFICEDCHEIFCEDCVVIKTEELLVCMQCNSKNVSEDKHGHHFCRDCGSRDMRNLKNLIPTCRNCDSGNVIRIEDKQEQLLDDYKSIISNTRSFVNPFEKMVERLNHFKSNLFQLRQDFPQCHHYPNLEADSQLLFKMFEAAKTNLYDHVNRFFQDIQRNIHYINEIRVTHPSNFTFIMEILRQFERERMKVVDLANSGLHPLESRLEPIEEKIEFMQTIQAQFNPFLGKLKLEPAEKIVFGIKCKLSTGVTEDKDFNNKNGTILITSKRLYFFHEQGVFKKRNVLLISVQITDLQYAGVKGKINKKVSLEFLNSMYKFTLSKENRDELVEWISKAQDFESQLTQGDNNLKIFSKHKIHIKVFREELENAIYELIGFHGSRNHNSAVSTSHAVNAKMYRTTNLPGPTKMTPPQIPHQYPSGTSSSSFQNPYLPNIPDLKKKSYVNNNFDSFATPAGHFGYPHDRGSLNEYFAEPGVISPQRSIVQPVPRYGGYNNPSTNPPFHPRNSSRNSYPTPPTPRFGSNLNSQTSLNQWSARGSEELEIKNEINQLRQEEFALNQTLKMLEQRYDGGYIQNVEFVKSYKELQRKYYMISNRITQLQQYLQENFSMNQN